VLDAFDLGLGYLTQESPLANHQGPRRHVHAFGHRGIRSYDAVFADSRAWQDCRPNGDQRSLFNAGPVDAGVVSKRDTGTDGDWMARSSFDDAVVLHIGLRPYVDARSFPAEDRAVEHTGTSGHAHVTYNRRTRCDVDL
jgi:hypothetical protein